MYIAWVFLGVWTVVLACVHSANKKAARQNRDAWDILLRERKRYDDATRLLVAHDTELRLLMERGKQQIAAGEQNRELERMILEDAVNRETRALVATQAVLRQAGCTEEQIETVTGAIKGDS